MKKEIEERYRLDLGLFNANIEITEDYLYVYPVITLVVTRGIKQYLSFLHSREIQRVIDILEMGKLELERKEKEK